MEAPQISVVKAVDRCFRSGGTPSFCVALFLLSVVVVSDVLAQDVSVEPLSRVGSLLFCIFKVWSHTV